jgi:hypothetical protein
MGSTLDMMLGPRVAKSLLTLKQRAEERAKAKGVVAESAPPVPDKALTMPPEEAKPGETVAPVPPVPEKEPAKEPAKEPKPEEVKPPPPPEPVKEPPPKVEEPPAAKEEPKPEPKAEEPKPEPKPEEAKPEEAAP